MVCEALDTNISLNEEVKELRYQLTTSQDQMFKARTSSSIHAQTSPISFSSQENSTLSLPSRNASDYRSDKISDPPIFNRSKAK